MDRKVYTQQNSVYLSIRPLFVVASKVYGSCAIHNVLSSTANGLRCSYRSIWLYYCLVFHVGVSLMMHATLHLRRQRVPVTIFYDLRKWCFLVALLTTDRERVDLLQGLERFDAKIHRLNKVKLIAYNPKLRGYLWMLTFHLVYTVGSNLLSFTMFYPRNKTVLVLFFDLMVKIFAAEMVFCYTVINVVFNTELCYRYRLLTASWVHHMQFFRSDPVASLPVQEQLRLLHADLTALAGHLSLCFGRFFVVNLFFVFLETLMYLYRTMLIDTNVFSNVQSVLFLLVNVASVPLLASSTYELLLASKAILNELRVVRIAELPRACGEQVILFVKQLHREQLTVTACGFFPIDRQLIVSMIVSMTTYFMVIIQMGEELGSLTASLFGYD